MAEFENLGASAPKKSFWKRPEGVTGTIFLAGLVLGGGYLLVQALPVLIGLASNLLYLAGMLLVLGVILYMVLDPKMRNLIGYMYKSVMRWITGIFVQIDPIGILKNYLEELQENLGKMSKQIGTLKGQMRKLKNTMEENNKEIQMNLRLASKAKEQNNQNQLVLASRKAARLEESNKKYESLFNKMTVMERILTKMYQNSEILLEDTKDQVKVKEQERKAIRASHGAMKSAMSVISGDPDQRAMFDQAMEVIADDVASKVGEMERFMEMSSNVMESVDLKNGMFEEQGMKMLEEWEQKSTLMLLGDDSKGLDINKRPSRPAPEKISRSEESSGNKKYDNLFD